MREYIVISFISSSLVYDFRSINEEEKKYVNKNSYYENSLYYTFNYFKTHIKKIIILLKKSNYKIDWFIVKRLVSFKYVVILFDSLNLIKLRLLFKSSLNLNDYELLLNSKILKELDVYYMPDFIIKKFKDNNVNVITHIEHKFSDKFLLSQDALDHDTLYYRKELIINDRYEGLYEDIKEFLAINHHLKAIRMYIYSIDLIEKLVDMIRLDESKNVIVFLYQKTDKGNFISQNFKWLKSINEICKKDNKCEFRIVYSSHFIKNNLFKQLTFTNIKLILLFGIYMCASMLVIYATYRYVDVLNEDKLKLELMNQVNNPTELSDIDEEAEEEEEIETFEVIFSELLKKNKDTVGYVIVNNTKISYPVVQSTDNSYYINHDFYKRYTYSGWIFLDYRNNSTNFDSNNILYGHSMKNGSMFGTLKKVLDSTFRSEIENMIISYHTPVKEYKFKIFSAYKVDYTTDYLKTNFDSKIEFNNFINMIKKRSVFTSNENIEYGDKILTLSTCTGSSNRRLVVHAVLREEE